MAGISKGSLIAVTLFVTAFAVESAWATTAPADPCSLLPASDVSKALGKNYGDPAKGVAPRPYKDTVEGTDCNYSPNGAGKQLMFRIYFDPSAADATGLHAKLKMFYSPPTPVPGIGDEAYFDPRHGLHVRKGNVRYFLSLGNEGDFTPASQKQVTDLAALVAGRL